MKKLFKSLLSSLFAVFTIGSLYPAYAININDVEQFIETISAKVSIIDKEDITVKHFDVKGVNETKVRALARLYLMKSFLKNYQFNILSGILDEYHAPENALFDLSDQVLELIKRDHTDDDSVMIYAILTRRSFNDMKNYMISQGD